MRELPLMLSVRGRKVFHTNWESKRDYNCFLTVVCRGRVS